MAKKATEIDPRWGEYQGTGIWYSCDGCGTLHPIEETTEFRALLEKLCDDIGASSQEIYASFEIGNPDGRWDIFPEEGFFKFTTADGRASIARYGVVASWNQESHSWLWAWAFPDDWTAPAALEVAKTVHAEGVKHGWQAVTEKYLAVDEDEAWHLTELAAHFSKMPLVYRAKVNEKNWHFFAIERPTWTN